MVNIYQQISKEFEHQIESGVAFRNALPRASETDLSSTIWALQPYRWGRSLITHIFDGGRKSEAKTLHAKLIDNLTQLHRYKMAGKGYFWKDAFFPQNKLLYK